MSTATRPNVSSLWRTCRGEFLTVGALLLTVFVSSPSPAVAQQTIRQFSWEDGVNDENEIAAPIFDSRSMAPVHVGAIQRSYDQNGLMFRRLRDLRDQRAEVERARNLREYMRSSASWTPGPEFYVDGRIDLARYLGEALQRQGAAMGLKMAKDEAGAWVLTGVLKDIHFVTDGFVGTVFFFGSTRVELALRDPVGRTTTHELDLFIYKAIGRFGFTDDIDSMAKEALALTLIEASHEIFAHLQRSTWHLPLHARTVDLVKRLEDADLNGLYRLGLTGSENVASRLTNLLPRRRDEDERTIIIEALGRLRSADSVAILDQRYATEDQDCRWATVKALAYIGTDRARAVLKEHGVADKYPGIRRLAEEILTGTR